MDISGTLHFYSGQRKEFFFVFDDDVAQPLYDMPEFDRADLNTRRVYISVGADRLIHRRTMSFSGKQTEIKVSLCSRGSKDGLRALTTLYDWFSTRGAHPQPFSVLGILQRVQHNGNGIWELWIKEPIDLVDPPGLIRRRKAPSRERRSYKNRRQFVPRDLAAAGRPAEELALELARDDFPTPEYSCLWRGNFLDSERIEICKMGIIADIDIWNEEGSVPELFIEVKAQKVPRRGADPVFYLSLAEWRSYNSAKEAHLSYQVWLFQYRDLRDFMAAPQRVELMVFDEISSDCLTADGYLVTPAPRSGQRFPII
jgi:hypothetical protein